MAKSRRTPTRPPRQRTPPTRPTGPRLYRKFKNPTHLSGPGAPPPGFIKPTNSATEWVAFWALWKALGLRGDPRNGPFSGWPGVFEYQSPYEGGRVVGGQVIDFVVLGTASTQGAIAIRITTERYHILTDYAKRAMDKILMARLGRFFSVVDVYEQDLIGDPSGQKAVITMKKAIFGGRTSDPIASGSARRFRG